MMARKRRYTLALALMLIFTVVAGCDQQEPADDSASSGSKSVAASKADEQKSTANEQKKAALKVYFSNEDASALVACEKSPSDADGDKYMQAVKLLIEGTKEQGAVAMIPPKTKLLGIKVENGIAYVNFSKELVKNFNGGSAGEIMLVGSIVNTLTEFKEIKAVQIMVDGEIAETISGHMDTSEPLRRFDHLLKK